MENIIKLYLKLYHKSLITFVILSYLSIFILTLNIESDKNIYSLLSCLIVFGVTTGTSIIFLHILNRDFLKYIYALCPKRESALLAYYLTTSLTLLLFVFFLYIPVTIYNGGRLFSAFFLLITSLAIYFSFAVGKMYFLGIELKSILFSPLIFLIFFNKGIFGDYGVIYSDFDKFELLKNDIISILIIFGMTLFFQYLLTHQFKAKGVAIKIANMLTYALPAFYIKLAILLNVSDTKKYVHRVIMNSKKSSPDRIRMEMEQFENFSSFFNIEIGILIGIAVLAIIMVILSRKEFLKERNLYPVVVINILGLAFVVAIAFKGDFLAILMPVVGFMIISFYLELRKKQKLVV